MLNWLASIAAACALVLAPSGARAEEPPINAVVTIGMIGDVVANVGGACVEATAIMGPGIDPHLYQASAQDVRTFRDADIILYSGYSLEGQLGDVLGRLSRMTPTVAVSEASIDRSELITSQGAYGVDPHLWMDAGQWARIAPTVARELAELRPDCAGAFEANLAAYVRELEALDGWAAEAVATIPEGHRVLVTAHDAFSYFGRAYELEVTGIQGISTESEAGVADIREMARTVAERGVPAVFVESTINPRTIQAVIEAARQQGHEVAIGGQLYSDAMGEAGTAAGTYIGMIHANTSAIVTALGGTLPPLPEALSGWAARWNVPASPRG